MLVFFCTVTAILIGAILRFTFAGEPLWLDELHTAWVVDGQLADVAARAAYGNQAPLYFWVTWTVVKLVGLNEIGLRLCSLLAGLSLIGGASWVTWRFTRSAAAATFVASILALDPTMIFYATEARPYAFVQIVGLAQIILFWSYWQSVSNTKRKPGKRIAVGLVVATTGLFYLHYSTVLLFASEFVFVLLSLSWKGLTRFLKPRSRSGNTSETPLIRNSCESGYRRIPVLKCALRMIAVLLATLLLISPTFVNLPAIWKRKENWASVSSAQELISELLPSFLIFIILAGSVCSIVFWFQRPRSSLTLQSRSVLPLLAACAVGPAVLAVGSDYFRIAPLSLTRYVVIGNVAMIMFAGIGIGDCQSRRLRLASLLLIFVLSIWHNPLVFQCTQTGVLPRFRHENWQDPVAQINQAKDKAQWPVFLFANVLEDWEANINSDPQFQEYLTFPVTSIYKVNDLDCPIIAMPSLQQNPFMKSHLKVAAEKGGAWLIIRATRDHADQIVRTFESAMPSTMTTDVFSSPSSDVILIAARIEDAIRPSE